MLRRAAFAAGPVPARQLSDVAVPRSHQRANFVANLRGTGPACATSGRAGLALRVLLTYPFTDQVLKDIKGDYLNTYLSIKAAPGTTVIAPVTPPASPTPTPAPQGGGR